MTKDEKAKLAGRLILGESWAFLQGPSGRGNGKTMGQVFDDCLKQDKDGFDGCTTTIVLAGKLVQLLADPKLIGIAIALQQTYNSCTDQTQAAFLSHLKDCEKFWSENKNNEALINEISSRD